ncbi:hypothetical protein SprV_0902664600 [Sparganum proliferum]
MARTIPRLGAPSHPLVHTTNNQDFDQHNRDLEAGTAEAAPGRAANAWLGSHTVVWECHKGHIKKEPLQPDSQTSRPAEGPSYPVSWQPSKPRLLAHRDSFKHNAGDLNLNAYWDAPQAWDVGYTTLKETCQEKHAFIQTLSSSQTYPLSTYWNGWCRSIDMRNFRFPIKLPQLGQENRLQNDRRPLSNQTKKTEITVSGNDYAQSLDSISSLVLNRVFNAYAGGSGLSPKWTFCRSPRMSFRPGHVSWWFFAVENCKSTISDMNGRKPTPPSVDVFYRLDLENGQVGTNIFRLHFAVEEFGILEINIIFWMTSAGTLFLGIWLILIACKGKGTKVPLYLFGITLLLNFSKWLFSLTWAFHLANIGVKLTVAEVLSDILGSVSSSALVALLMLLASGYTVVHQQCQRRLHLSIVIGLSLYLLMQIVLGITKTLAFDSGRARYLYQSPTGYILAALQCIAWAGFALVCIYTNLHWTSKRLFYIKLVAVYTLWFWTIPIILIINGEWMPLWRRLVFHRAVESIADLGAHIYLLYMFLPSQMPANFLPAEEDETQLTASGAQEAKPGPRGTIQPVQPTREPEPPSTTQVPKLPPLGRRQEPSVISKLGAKPGELPVPSQGAGGTSPAPDLRSLGSRGSRPVTPRPPPTPRAGMVGEPSATPSKLGFIRKLIQ